MNQRTIPSSGEEIPVIGIGTWQTFEGPRAPLVDVLRRFAAAGGRVIDTSPMYGRAEEVAGELMSNIPHPFVATKVWTRGRERGIEQMTRSAELLRVTTIDLMQIHNLLDWRTHLATLRAWKSEGRIRYIGITHYTTSAFDELESIMRSETIDSLGEPGLMSRLFALPKSSTMGVALHAFACANGVAKRQSIVERAAPPLGR